MEDCLEKPLFIVMAVDVSNIVDVFDLEKSSGLTLIYGVS